MMRVAKFTPTTGTVSSLLLFVIGLCVVSLIPGCSAHDHHHHDAAQLEQHHHARHGHDHEDHHHNHRTLAVGRTSCGIVDPTPQQQKTDHRLVER